MTNSTITQQLGEELLGFLDREAQFIGAVERCAVSLSDHPVGQSFPNKLIEQLTAVQKEVGARNLERATLQRKLAGELLKTPAAIRLSSVNAGPEVTDQLQTRRREVLKQSRSAEGNLRTALNQMTESNAIVTAVLDAVLGAQVDRSRYNSDGKPVPQISHVEGQRVA